MKQRMEDERVFESCNIIRKKMKLQVILLGEKEVLALHIILLPTEISRGEVACASL
jgi:hypothetical protein